MKKPVVFVVVIVLGVMAIAMSMVITPFDKNLQEKKIFSVIKGQNVFEIGKNLEDQKLIRRQWLFTIAVLSKNGVKNLKTGNYLLSPAISPLDIASIIISGKTAQKTIVIPEGWTIEQIASYLKSKSFVSVSQQDYSSKYDFLTDKPEDLNLEGYLFPDTYYLNLNNSEQILVEKMLDNFDKKLDPELRKEIQSQDKTIFEIITMASLLEKEVQNKGDKEIVAGILWKRMALGMFLNVDASVSYALGGKTNLSKLDLKIDSPYNTYKYKGLPLGPIANPGLESIMAAVYPQPSPYLYYLSALNNNIVYSQTLAEHIRAIEKYLK